MEYKHEHSTVAVVNKRLKNGVIARTTKRLKQKTVKIGPVQVRVVHLTIYILIITLSRNQPFNGHCLCRVTTVLYRLSFVLIHNLYMKVSLTSMFTFIRIKTRFHVKSFVTGLTLKKGQNSTQMGPSPTAITFTFHPISSPGSHVTLQCPLV